MHMCLDEKNESLPTLDQAGDVKDWQGERCRQRLCFLKSTESHPRKKHKKIKQNWMQQYQLRARIKDEHTYSATEDTHLYKPKNLYYVLQWLL